jgi:hypothetical protein
LSKEEAPPPLRRWLHTIGAGVASACGYLSIWDYGNHVDGPGIGFSPMTGSALRLLWILGTAGYVVGVVLQQRKLRAALVGLRVGVVLFVVLLFTRTADRLLGFSWQGRCADGEARACLGMGDLRRAGLVVDRDETLATRFYLEACEGGEWVGCDRILEVEAAPSKPRACDLVRAGCEVKQDRFACGTRDRHCAAATK